MAEFPPSPPPGPTRKGMDTPSGLPMPESSRSFWHSEPSAALLGHRTTEDLPPTADVVIVGSGITGAFAAWFLKEDLGSGGGVKGGGEESVVMLEAREACWGATGRNGGHIQPFLYASPPSAARFELATYTFLRRFISHHAVPCDWTDLHGVHAFLSEPLWSDVAAAVTSNKALHPELLATVEVVSDRARLGELGVPGVCGAVVQERAGSLWPYKLVVFLLEGLVERYGGGGAGGSGRGSAGGGGFNLQTGTPVLGVHPDGAGDGGWVVKTERGDIRARKVLLATNGYTSYLVEGMADLIVPVRGQVGALVPPTTTGGRDGVDISTQHSYCFFAEGAAPEKKRDEYLIQRPPSSSSSSSVPGYFIYGGGRSLARGRAVGEWRDDEVEGGVAQFLRRELMPPLEFTTAAAATQTELKADYEWTGIMGYSRDGHPWVGPVPASLSGGGDGLFVAAGYSGHGMPNTVLAAHAVVRAMRGEDLGGEGGKGGVDGVEYVLPEEFLVTDERVERARGGKTVGEMDLGGWGAEFAMLGRV